MERGTVLAVTADKRKFAVVVDGDSCASFELEVPAELAVGHRLRGNLESEFCFSLENLSTGEPLGVTHLAHHDTADEARRAIGA